jgi:hypothetical protein
MRLDLVPQAAVAAVVDEADAGKPDVSSAAWCTDFAQAIRSS